MPAPAATTPELHRDRGQAAILLVVVVVTLGIVLAAALADFGGHVLDRGRAQHAADAAALASLDGGVAAAGELARRNGAVLVSWQRGPGPDEVTVVVRVGDSTATARASNALP
ncbi:MAG: pilus assembly protein TadG-related protein [Ilumatobacteraceae bacterium]